MIINGWYKPEDNDVIKVLPFLRHDGSLASCYEGVGIFYDKVVILDDLNKKHLIRICEKHNTKPGSKRIPIVRRSYFLVLINGETKFMAAPTSLSNVIHSSIVDVNNNQHFKIVKEMVRNNGVELPHYRNTYVVDIDWEKPQDLHEWLLCNQPFYMEEYFAKNSIFKNMELIKKAFGEDLIKEVISDDRDMKISSIIT